MKKIVISILLLHAVYSYADPCENCTRDQPNGATTSAGMANKGNAAAPMKSYKSIDIEGLQRYCVDYKKAGNDNTVRPLLIRIEDKGYDPKVILSMPGCSPARLSSKESIPPIQLSAEDPTMLGVFPREIYRYYEKQQSLSSWYEIINTKNSQGMTFLDYVKYIYNQDKTFIDADLKKEYVDLYQFVCTHGGEFSKYPGSNCQSIKIPY